METSLTLRDYAVAAWRARWPILALVIIAAGAAWGIGETRPKVYRATAVILAPKENNPQSAMGSLGALLGGGGREGGGLSFPGISIGLPPQSSNLDVFSALLRSRTMREEVMEGLSKAWGPAVPSMIVSVDTLTARDRTTLSLTVEATNPRLAAEVANAYFEYLDRRLQQQADRDARRQEVFYRAQLERAAKEVDIAEDALIKFQAENRMPPVEATSKSSAESGGSLRGSIMALELHREVMRMRYTEQHPQMREMDKQIAEMKKQYSKNLFGSAMELPPEGPNTKGMRKELFVSAEKMTPTQFAYLKLLRNVKMQEAFYTGALQGLEQMRYATEHRPQGTDPLDPALAPGNHVRPNVRVIVLAAAVAALVVGVLLALVDEYVRLVRAQTHEALLASAHAGVSRPNPSRRPANGGVTTPSGAPRATV